METLRLDEVNARLEGRPPREIVQWAYERFGDSLAMSCSFQSQSIPLLSIVAQAAPRLPILFLDTGYHFPETLAFRDRLVRSWGLNLVVLRGDKAAETAAARGSGPLYRTDPDHCCYLNKVAPMQDVLSRYPAWISGIRRDQSETRAHIKIVEVNAKGSVRVHPMAAWTEKDVAEHVKANELPEHPLSWEGFTSIGCAPCTSKPAAEGGARSGRWAGREKTECGLHTLLRAPATEEGAR